MEINERSRPPVSPIRMPRPAFIVGLSLVLAVGCGVSLGRFISTPSTPSLQATNFYLLSEAWGEIQRHYVDRKAIEPTALTYGAISGMVDALGDIGHSAFLTPTMVRQLKDAQQGRLKGIGAEIQMKKGQAVIVAPIDGSPAQRAGLKPGDIILRVDGQDISNLGISQIAARISGLPGTPVRLTIVDPRLGRTNETTIVRASIQLRSVTWQRLPQSRLWHVRISDFEEGTAKHLRQALREMNQSHPDGIILDLRNNPGGILDEAVTVASQFLKTGNVLINKDAKGHLEPVPVESGGLALDLPLVVLINNGSASAAEIVAGAIKDAQRAPLVGETTFGTGTVLREFELSDGSALLLAIREWLTPSGHSFWHKGITPTVAVPTPPEATFLLPELERQLTPAGLEASGDTQLLRAIALLKTMRQP